MIDVLWALVGAVLSFLLYIGWEHLMLLKRHAGFFGVWRSTWQPTFDDGWHWVTDSATMRRRSDRVLPDNANNYAGHEGRGGGRILGY